MILLILFFFCGKHIFISNLGGAEALFEDDEGEIGVTILVPRSVRVLFEGLLYVLM